MMSQAKVNGQGTQQGEKEILDPVGDLGAYLPVFQSALQKATRLANSLPEPDDIAFHKSFDRSFAKKLESASKHLLGLAGSLVDLVTDANSKALPRKTEKPREQLSPAEIIKGRKRLLDADDVVENFDKQVQEAIDALLEQADTNLDIVTGRRKAAAIAIKEKAVEKRKLDSSLNLESRDGSTSSSGALPRSILFADIPKPQLQFETRVDNLSVSSPWKPNLAFKHHGVVPLDYVPSPSTSRSASPAPALNNQSSSDKSTPDPQGPSYSIDMRHPYAYETKHMIHPSSIFTWSDPIPPKSFAATPFEFVDTPERLAAMTAKLVKAEEIAVDLEYHSWRTYSGFTCLMQISTRDEDFVVDTIKLREEIRRDKLGGVMADQSVLKVFHGAESDIIWLQQDFDIYVVGLFDTYHATKVLHHVQHSLAGLLKAYCDYQADKRYQLADWRIRPLPEEMMQYARSDTHFLLFIYDNLRNSLLDRASGTQDLIRQVLIRSAATSTQVYEGISPYNKEGFGRDGWRSAIRKKFGNKTSSASPEEYGTATDRAIWGIGPMAYQRERVFRRLHEWRDKKAREDDESAAFILGINQLWQIVFRPFQSASEIASLSHPQSWASRHAEQVHQVVQAAISEGDEMFGREQESFKGTSGGLGPQVSVMGSSSAKTESDPADDIPVVGSSLFAASSRALPAASQMFGRTLDKLNGEERPLGDSHQTPQQRLQYMGEVIGRVLNKLQTPLGEDDSDTEELQQSSPKELITSKAEVTSPVQPNSSRNQHPITIPSPPISRPTESRKSTPEPVKKDAIVVVGKQSDKKRKKAKTAANEQSTPAKKAKNGPQDFKMQDIPEFDYANEPNQLDTFAPEPKSKGKDKGARKSKKKGAMIDTSAFRKPPSNPSEISSGNKSRTF